MKRWIKPIDKLNACGEALKWAEDYKSLDEAWLACERGDWMLWLLGKLSGKPESDSRKKLVLAACQCARLALPYIEKGELRPLKAIETAEEWARGERGITLQNVRDAAAYAAAYADAAAHAAYAADDASHAAAYAAFSADDASHAAAYAADDASHAAADAAHAAAHAAYAADDASHAADAAHAAAHAAYAARRDILKKCADIVRGYYPIINLKGGG